MGNHAIASLSQEQHLRVPGIGSNKAAGPTRGCDGGSDWTRSSFLTGQAIEVRIVSRQRAPPVGSLTTFLRVGVLMPPRVTPLLNPRLATPDKPFTTCLITARELQPGTEYLSMRRLLILDSSVVRGTPSLLRRSVRARNAAAGFRKRGFDEFSFLVNQRRLQTDRRLCFRLQPRLFHRERVRVAEDHSSFDHILKLSDIARPVVSL